MMNCTGDFYKDKIDIILETITNYFMLETEPPLAPLETNYTSDNFRIIAEAATFPKLCNKPKDKRQQIISTGEVISWNMQGSNSLTEVKRFLKTPKKINYDDTRSKGYSYKHRQVPQNSKL